jgi:hypothetical protein
LPTTSGNAVGRASAANLLSYDVHLVHLVKLFDALPALKHKVRSEVHAFVDLLGAL